MVPFLSLARAFGVPPPAAARADVSFLIPPLGGARRRAPWAGQRSASLLLSSHRYAPPSFIFPLPLSSPSPQRSQGSQGLGQGWALGSRQCGTGDLGPPARIAENANGQREFCIKFTYVRRWTAGPSPLRSLTPCCYGVRCLESILFFSSH